MLLVATIVFSGGTTSNIQALAADSEPVTVKTEKDVYVQGGGSKDEVMNHKDGWLCVKTTNAGGLEGSYHRNRMGCRGNDLEQIS